MASEFAAQLPASKLRPSVRMHDAAVHVSAHPDGVTDSAKRERCLHARVDRVAHDPAAEGVLDRAKIKSAFARFVFRDAGQPELVRPGSDELVTLPAVLVDDDTEIVMNSRTRLLAAPAPLLPEHTPSAVQRCDRPRCPLRHRLVLVAAFVDEAPIPELRVATVSIEQRVRAIHFLQLTPRDGVTQPAVVRLTSERQYPARHHDSNPVSGEPAHERVHYFPGR